MRSKVRVRVHLKRINGTLWLTRGLLIRKMKKPRGKRTVVRKIHEME
jgi:hypothetical protein